MATLTVELSEEIYQRLRLLARETDSQVEQVAAAAIETLLLASESRHAGRVGIDAEVEAMRQSLGAQAVDPATLRGLLDEYGGPITPEESEALLQGIPPLDPPLSRTIIDEREDRL